MAQLLLTMKQKVGYLVVEDLDKDIIIDMQEGVFGLL